MHCSAPLESWDIHKAVFVSRALMETAFVL
jgi:hypothetical protein